MTIDEHDHHRRGGLGCFPVLLGFFIGVAATLAALILLGLWGNQSNPPIVEPSVAIPPGAARQGQPQVPPADGTAPPPSPLLQPDGVPIAEDAPPVSVPEAAAQPEAPAAPSPAPAVRAKPARPQQAPRHIAPPAVRTPAPAARAPAPAARVPAPTARAPSPPAAKPQVAPRAAQPRDRIEDDAAASGLTSRSR